MARGEEGLEGGEGLCSELAVWREDVLVSFGFKGPALPEETGSRAGEPMGRDEPLEARFLIKGI